MRIICVAGTWAANPPWIEDPCHPFQQMLARAGVQVARSPRTGEPFRWPTGLSGLPFVGRDLWPTWGKALLDFAREFPYEDRNVLAHSHGGQVAIYALALGAPIGLSQTPAPVRFRTLTTVGTPVRADVPAVQAATNVRYWQHIIDKDRDWIATVKRHLPRQLGGVGDNALLGREFRIPGVNNILATDIDHSDVLTDPEDIELWASQHWLEGIRTAGGLEPRCA